MLGALAALMLSAASAPAPRLWVPGELRSLSAEDLPEDGAPVLALCDGRLQQETARIRGGRLEVGCDATLVITDVATLSLRRVTPARVRAGEWIRSSPSGAAYVELKLGGHRWRIDRVRLASTGYRLELRALGDRRKPPVTLYEAQSTDAARWQLLWAGDLDGDGEVDLLVEASDASDWREVHLFLSRGAEELVDEVATQRLHSR